jgi:hypothetical protein
MAAVKTIAKPLAKTAGVGSRPVGSQNPKAKVATPAPKPAAPANPYYKQSSTPSGNIDQGGALNVGTTNNPSLSKDQNNSVNAGIQGGLGLGNSIANWAFNPSTESGEMLNTNNNPAFAGFTGAFNDQMGTAGQSSSDVTSATNNMANLANTAGQNTPAMNAMLQQQGQLASQGYSAPQAQAAMEQLRGNQDQQFAQTQSQMADANANNGVRGAAAAAGMQNLANQQQMSNRNTNQALFTNNIGFQAQQLQNALGNTQANQTANFNQQNAANQTYGTQASNNQQQNFNNQTTANTNAMGAQMGVTNLNNTNQQANNQTTNQFDSGRAAAALGGAGLLGSLQGNAVAQTQNNNLVNAATRGANQ